jgi:phosphoglycolate phosphatase-like HAD superfamily hydrolase
MHPLLLLWDIDGTLILAGGAGEEALRQALLNGFGIRDDLKDVEMAGRTDISILDDICRRHPGRGLTPEKYLEGYLAELPLWLPRRKGRVLPGVRELLEWAHAHPEVHNALLTGNVSAGAHLKLKHYGLDRFFEFGAYGDDSGDRNKLGPLALERARAHLKKDFHIRFTWVIGDTPHDVTCARALGCKALAVATGKHSVRTLQDCHPDAVFSDLSDRARVINRLLMDGAVHRSA